MGIIGAIVCLAFFFLFLLTFRQRLPEGQGPKFRRWLARLDAQGIARANLAVGPV